MDKTQEKDEATRFLVQMVLASVAARLIGEYIGAKAGKALVRKLGWE